MEKHGLKLAVSVLLGLMLLAIPLTGVCAPPKSQETIVLRFGTGFMEGQAHSVPQAAFLDEIEKKSNGRIKFQRFYGGTLIGMRDSDAQIQARVADLGMSSCVYSPTGYKLGKATMGFFARVSDTATLLRMHEEFRKKFPELEKEVAHLKQLGWVATPAEQIMTCKTPIRKVEDFKGLQLRCLARYSGAISKLGAAVISMSAGDLYVALQKGTIDGLLGPIDMLKALKLVEVTKYVTLTNLAVPAMPILGMNWDTWNSLPPDIQKIFEDNSKDLPSAYMKFFGQQVDESYNLADKNGIDRIELPPEELEKLYKAIDEDSKRKAAALDKQGFRGTEMLEEAHRLIKKYKNI
jgi:TRAP-type C4-dicarboxylate transport system substrate-binding protein